MADIRGVPSAASWTPTFVDVYLEPCVAAEDGLSMRFKSAGHSRPVQFIPYESEAGVAGRWNVTAVAAEELPAATAAMGVPVEDSSDGTAWLIFGGIGGLRLEHVETGAVVREPYLILAIGSDLA